MIPLGFTLIEMLLVVALLGVLFAIALPTYSSYVDRARGRQAIGDIKKIELLIERFNTVNFRLPASLGEMGDAVPTDPWDRAYIYLNITTAKGKGDVRKDKKLNPINSDYDLYSMGKDGNTKKQLDNKDSLDDVVRANSGGYVGLAEDY